MNIDLPDNRLSILKYIYHNTPTNSKSPITKIIKFTEGMLWFRSTNEGRSFLGLNSTFKTLDEMIINNLEEFENFLSENG